MTQTGWKLGALYPWFGRGYIGEFIRFRSQKEREIVQEWIRRIRNTKWWLLVSLGIGNARCRVQQNWAWEKGVTDTEDSQKDLFWKSCLPSQGKVLQFYFKKLYFRLKSWKFGILPPSRKNNSTTVGNTSIHIGSYASTAASRSEDWVSQRLPSGRS